MTNKSNNPSGSERQCPRESRQSINILGVSVKDMFKVRYYTLMGSRLGQAFDQSSLKNRKGTLGRWIFIDSRISWIDCKLISFVDEPSTINS